MGKTHSARTKDNKQRKAERRQRRLQRAAERRLAPSEARTAPERRVQDEHRSEQHRRVIDKQFSRKAKREFKAHPRKGEISPTEAGERQFGNSAKGYHLHQRSHRLARALTPDEFQKWQKQQSLKGKNKDRETEALLFHVATGGDLET